MKKYEPLNGEAAIKLSIKEFSRLKAEAYQAGQFNNPKWFPKFQFEVDAYNKALADEATVKEFIK